MFGASHSLPKEERRTERAKDMCRPDRTAAADLATLGKTVGAAGSNARVVDTELIAIGTQTADGVAEATWMTRREQNGGKCDMNVSIKEC